VVIVDLEDAVALKSKAAARAAASSWLSNGGQAVVRINSDPRLAAADLDALAGSAGVLGIMIPKAEDTTGTGWVAARMGPIAVIPLVENALGIARARELANAPATCRLALGSLDLGLDLGFAQDSAAMACASFELVLASRLCGLPAPIATVTTEIGDGSPAAEAARISRAEGFGAKLCIHPRQLSGVDAAFRPTTEEVSWARQVVAAAETGSLALVEGAMVDRPVVARALRILTDADTDRDHDAH
jgi:citrate lyase subunit beta/citryl-CoA lyase